MDMKKSETLNFIFGNKGLVSILKINSKKNKQKILFSLMYKFSNNLIH
jgi:hypothetical protein